MIPKHVLSERELWFRSKVGARLFRNHNGCNCPSCEDTVKNGVLVYDESQADYLYDTEVDYNLGGFPLRYFDTKEEATEFSVQQEK